MSIVGTVLKTFVKELLGKGSLRSYSQDGEDALIVSILKSKKGVYVDVGAYHPTLYSNTYALYKRGWSGIVIDPNDAFKPLYSIWRPRDTFVASGVGSVKECRPYFEFKDGAYNTFDATIAEKTKQKRYPDFLKETTRPIMPLRDIMSANGVTKVDLLNIDVEGLEEEVLSSYDWSILPKLIVVEDNNFTFGGLSSSPLFTQLTARGYVPVACTPRTLFFVLENQVV